MREINGDWKPAHEGTNGQEEASAKALALEAELENYLKGDFDEGRVKKWINVSWGRSESCLRCSIGIPTNNCFFFVLQSNFVTTDREFIELLSMKIVQANTEDFKKTSLPDGVMEKLKLLLSYLGTDNHEQQLHVLLGVQRANEELQFPRGTFLVLNNVYLSNVVL